MKERRWAAIASDGRHVWLGRNSDPSADEIEAAARAFREAGITAWLAVTEGVYHSADPMVMLMVRPLHGEGDWEAAAEAFLARRRNTAASQP